MVTSVIILKNNTSGSCLKKKKKNLSSPVLLPGTGMSWEVEKKETGAPVSRGCACLSWREMNSCLKPII